MRNRIALFFGEQRTLILMQRTIDFPLQGAQLLRLNWLSCDFQRSNCLGFIGCSGINK